MVTLKGPVVTELTTIIYAYAETASLQGSHAFKKIIFHTFSLAFQY